MRVTYIYHSCFLVETRSRYYLFDWFRGQLPQMDPGKPVLVLASHDHRDHYDPAVFDRLAEKGMTCQAMLAMDIPQCRYPAAVSVTTAQPGESYQLEDGTVIRTLRSTDEGVAWLVEDPEGCLYHAGDLNDWYWEGEPEVDNQAMTEAYRQQIRQLERADVAFVVLDPRQGSHYADGMLYFLEHVDCGCVFPMHYWEQPKTIKCFVLENPQYQNIIQNTEQTKGSEIKCSSK